VGLIQPAERPSEQRWGFSEEEEIARGLQLQPGPMQPVLPDGLF
jgi:hypothetical protein